MSFILPSKMLWNFAGLFFFVGSIICAPNDLKTAVDGGNEGTAAAGLGASASFAGFSASAGLGGTAGGVAANKPSSDVPEGATGSLGRANAGATIGLTKNVVVSPAQQTGPSFFDRIFNIPISILHSVNDHLNSRGAVRKAVVVSANAGAAGGEHAPSATPDATVYSSATAIANSGATTGDSGSETVGHGLDVRTGSGHTSNAATTTVVARKPGGFYDSVFNIPISALRSVNQLLNG